MALIDDPINVETYTSLRKGLGVPDRYAIAVSGGSDSLALAVLAAEEARLGRASVVALTVDHGLRENSSDEAFATSKSCADLGLEHKVLRWTGTKPQTGIQAAARTARYRLLIDAAGASQCAALLTAHTATDQAETILMRLARGAGASGLSAMAPMRRVASGPGAPLMLYRPFLDVTRRALKATLERHDQDYLRDPSNADPAFERVRVRGLLAATDEQDILTIQGLCESAHRLRAQHADIKVFDQRAAERAGLVFYRWGGASLSTRALSVPGASRILGKLIFAVGGQEHPPSQIALEKTFATLNTTSVATLGGVLMTKSSGKLTLFREPSAISGRHGVSAMAPIRLSPGRAHLWDRRFIVENTGSTSCDIKSVGLSDLCHSIEADMPENAIYGYPIGVEGATKGVSVSITSIVPERFRHDVIRF